MADIENCSTTVIPNIRDFDHSPGHNMGCPNKNAGFNVVIKSINAFSQH
jgi:hypothetical protein